MSMISRLGVVLGLDSAEFNAGLGKAEAGLKSFAANSVTSKLSLAALATGITLATAEAINFADKINDVAKANEVAVGTVLNLSKALTVNGGESENTAKMFASFTNKIDDAAKGGLAAQKSFSKLGITIDDLRKLSQQELFSKAMAGLADPKMGDVITRNATAMDLFGKSVKGVDIAGMANDFSNNKETFNKQEEAFKAIGKAMDSYDIALQKTKERMATDLAPVLTGSIKFFDTMINGWTRLEGHINAAAKKQEEYVARTQGVLPFKPAKTIYDPITAADAAKLGGSQRDVEVAVDPEQKKRIEAAKRLLEAMTQQSLEYQRQRQYIGEIQTNASKLAIDFERGGKYAGQQNTELGKRLIAEAKALDIAKEREVIRQDAISKTINQAKLDEALAKSSRDALQSVIARRETERERFDLATQDIQIAAERLDYEKQLAGLSDTQREKALEFFDLSRKMKRMAEQEIGLDAGQLEKRQQAEQERITSSEENKRAQRTFQAGWDNAYNNFVERAKDSAAIGASAFNNMASNMTSALDTFVETGKISFSSLIGSMIKDLLKMQLQAQASGFFSQLVSSAFGAFGASKGTSGSLGKTDLMNSKLNFAAEGGYIDSPTVVGERGMELFIPKSPGTVIPNNALASMMGSQPQVVYNGTVVQNMSAIDTQSATQFLARNKQAVWASNMSAQRSLPMSR